MAVAAVVAVALAATAATSADPSSKQASPSPSASGDSSADSAQADSSAGVSAPADTTVARQLLIEFEARYDRYLEIEERCRQAGADPVHVIEAQALSLEAERLAAGGEVEPAMALLGEAIGILEGQCRAGETGWPAEGKEPADARRFHCPRSPAGG
jgi:hypothetical protein